MLTSCNVYLKAVGAGGNPEPNLKSIHMASIHPGYTQEDYDAHPDWDCTTYYLEPIYATNPQNGKKVLMGYVRRNRDTNRID